MRTNNRFILSLACLSLASALVGCGGGKASEQPVAGAPGDVGQVDAAPGEEGYFLTVEGAAAIQAAPGSTVTVELRLFRFGGDAAATREVRFWLEGAPNDAKVMAEAGRTDADGMTRCDIVVGPDEGSFQFAANAELADDVFVEITVQGDAVVAPEREVIPIPDAAGTYDVQSSYDLTSRLGDGGERIRQVAAAFENPGRFLAGFISVDGFVGSLIEGVTEQVINDLVIANSPAWLQGSLTIGDDILSLLTDLKVRSELVVAKVHPGVVANPDADNAAEVAGALPSWEGTHTWKAVRYEWEAGCPPNVEGCGESELLLPADATAHSLRGTATLDGAIAIHDHPMDVPVAPLAVRLVTQVILPAKTGHASFQGMLGELVDCNDFGAMGEQAVGVPFTSGLISAGCRAGLEEASAALEQQLTDAIQIDMGALSGEARAMDEDRDGSFDKWGAGVWTGVQGTFTAIRR